MTDLLLHTHFPRPCLRGKVRDKGDHLLMVATDHISAFDVFQIHVIKLKQEI